MKNMKIDFIINPNSGKGKHQIRLEDLQNFLGSNYRITTHFTAYQYHAKELVLKALENKPDMIVACGGDGTINEVASALVGKEIPLGVIPCGSGNGLATNLGIPKDPKKALEIIKNFNVQSIDVGKVGEEFFFSNLGFGIDAEVIKRYEQKQKRTISGYVDASLKSVLNYKPKKFKVTVDNEIFDKAFYYLFCSNSNMAGYGISFTPRASLSDGVLDLLMVEDLNMLQQVYFSMLVLTKQIERLDKAIYKQVKSFELLTEDNSITYQLDGEFKTLDASSLKIQILEKALKVVY